MKQMRILAVAMALLLSLLGAMMLSPDPASAEPLLATLAMEQSVASAPITPTYWVAPNPAYRIAIVGDGLYALTYGALQQAGLPVDTLDPQTMRIFYMGREIAIQVLGEADGRFEAGDAVLFYARSVDSLYFEGLLPDHRFTGTNVYFLTYGGDLGKRMAAQDGSLAGAPAGPFLQVDHQEKQSRYVSEYPRYESGPLFDPRDDHWFWYKLQIFGATGSKVQNIPFALDNVASGALTGTAKVHVVGGYDALHGVRLRINGSTNANLQNSSDWQAFEPYTLQGAAPQSYFVNGANTVQVEMFNVNSIVSENYIDWVEISYYKNHVAVNNQLSFRGEPGNGPWRYTLSNFGSADVAVYDVTDMHAVRLVDNLALGSAAPYSVTFGAADQGRRYVALTPARRLAPASIERVSHRASAFSPSQPWAIAHGGAGWDLLDAQNGADWIVITHRDFWTATLPLADYRAKQFRVAMVDVQEIYDQFNGGLPSPVAIHDFLAYAYAHWQTPAPQFVLLAGGGTSDMRPYFTNSKKTYVPAFIYPADPILGETAADNRFVTFLNDDLLPDMHIGRFPAYSAFEISTMVSKTISYEATPTFNDWTTNVLFIADDIEDGGGNFYQFSDTLADGSADPLDPAGTKFLPAPYTALKAYLGQTCDVANNPTFATECRVLIADIINNQGALFVSYIGHAQTSNWAVEKLMDLALANSLTNFDKLAIFLPMACFEGFFHLPSASSRSLAETYLLNPNGGAVASWSPAGYGVATGHDWLEQGFFLAVFQQGVTRLGQATTLAKEFLAANAPLHKYDDMLETYNLLGDPALQIQTYLAPTAVDVVDLQAQRDGDGVVISWQTETETTIAGFNVMRSDSEQGHYTTVSSEIILANQPGGTNGSQYTYRDATVSAQGEYWYKIQILRLNGDMAEVGPVRAGANAPVTRLLLPAIFN